MTERRPVARPLEPAHPAEFVPTPEDLARTQAVLRFIADVAVSYQARAEALLQSVRLTAPADVARLLSAEMGALQQEQLRVVLLTTTRHVIAAPIIYQGTVNSAPVRVAEVFRPAIVQNAPALIIAHNHPSGMTDPSPDDLVLTRQLLAAGALLSVSVLDHVILAGDRFCSLRERGYDMDWGSQRLSHVE